MQYPQVFGYLIPVLVGILGASVQGSSKPLFETNIQNMWTFFIASVLYCCALAADYSSRERRTNSSSKIWSVIAVVSGSLSSVSVISIFLPHSISCIILYAAWISGAIIILVYQYGGLVKNASCWLYHEILRKISSNIWNGLRANTVFSNIWDRFQGNNSFREQQQLPV
ncbi:hypothetical protein OWV82_012401 [Melia azedarach]|uniref:Uncharacterized protein n=1 Tax=Melia azedarach TaxID=155640 RepID=A0ACC1Y4V4_MELAZ|nr:hypothetical protein OWV82_012401 [Melia azedarach]